MRGQEGWRAALVGSLLSTLAASCRSLAPQSDPAHKLRGPLPTRVQHPLALTLPNLSPRSAQVQAKGAWTVGADFAYSSIFERSASSGSQVAFDAEVLRTSLRLRRGLGARVDLELQFAGVYGSGGFLDHFITEFHDFIGAPNQGRDTAPDNQFEARIERDGESVWSWNPDRAQLGDTLVVLTCGEEHLEEGEWGNAWRVGLDLPTGDEKSGAGSGSLDWIVGWSGEVGLGAATHFFGASYGVAQAPSGFARTSVELPARQALFYGVEWRWSDRLSWVFQFDFQSPLVNDLQLKEIDQPILDLGVGFVRDLGPDTRWWFSFHEDVLADSGPDFALHLGWGWGR